MRKYSAPILLPQLFYFFEEFAKKAVVETLFSKVVGLQIEKIHSSISFYEFLDNWKTVFFIIFLDAFFANNNSIQ